MSRQRVAFRDDGSNMIHQDVFEQRGADGYHVRITTTERLSNPMEAPRYQNFGYFFDNNCVYEGSYANPRQSENVLEKKHHAQYEPVTEYAPVQRNYPQYEPVTEKVPEQRHRPHYEPVAEKVMVKKHHARYEPVHDVKQQTYEEDVNKEADDFIKRKHRALERSKFMTMRSPQ